MVMLLAGCGDLSDVRVVMSVGMSKDEVFRVDDMTCNRIEMLVYISNIAGEYVDVYGRDIFEASVEGETLGENVKQLALAKGFRHVASAPLARSSYRAWEALEDTHDLY